MPCKIQNKMYILSGGVTSEDTLNEYRFITKQGFAKVPWTYTHRLFDTALEIDMTGKNIEFDKYKTDSYWTTWDETKLKNLKVTAVAYIDPKSAKISCSTATSGVSARKKPWVSS